ncbi:MAG: type II toxin-antitoxin system RelE/ParE family toxin [Balneolaceae bacterium]|nr:type II toxin-antitoxin system RelE/ParE family toxin [Balneolaceae bacterium]
MTWKVEFDNRARKELRKLDPETQKRLLTWISENLIGDDDARDKGSALKGRFRGLWRYRVGDYRVACQIKDEEVLILILRIAHRKDVYD